MGLFSVKMVLISTGVLSIAMGLKLTVPVISHFLLSKAPSIWSFLLTWLTPPYLYLLLNFIILTLYASSKFQNHNHAPPHAPTDPLISADIPSVYAAAYDGTTTTTAVILPPVEISGPVQQTDYNDVVSDGYVYDPNVPKTTTSNDAVTVTNGSEGYAYDKQNVAAKTTVANGALQRKDSLDFGFNNENEKPPVSARFSHRKAVKASPEGGKVFALGVAKPKKQDALESTWRTITEGRAMPLTRHLKKCDTWETQTRRNAAPLTDLNGDGGAATPRVMKKSETFGGGEKSASPGGSGGKLRKEPSLSQDELNRRVEAFINKFNAEMRLQRQESLRQYREMLDRGAH